jgi:hypothetical protein
LEGDAGRLAADASRQSAKVGSRRKLATDASW